MKKIKKRYAIPLIAIGAAAILTLLGRAFKSFADFYADNIFPVISTPYAFLSGLLPISLGELMIIAAIVVFGLGIPTTIIMLIFAKKLRKQTISVFLTTTVWILAFVSVTESLNCFTLYGCTRFSERFFTASEHDDEQLMGLYSYLIDECNKLAKEVPRDENNRFTLTIDAVEEAKKSMKKAAEYYPQLKGYYPDPKPIMFSFFMSQTSTSGMYFPFSMEATYNNDLVPERLPSVMCHEYAHLKGFMQEDECNFISFIATLESDEPQVRYCGYIDALQYVNNQIFENEVEEAYVLNGLISEEVDNDWFRYFPETYWEDNSEKELISTETVDTVFEAASDTSMKLNGVEDGTKSYSRMVNLLLDYYFPADK